MKAHISDMMQWLLSKNLVLNTAKTEIFLFGFKQQWTKVSQPVTVCMGDSAINTSTMARKLRVKFDSHMSFHRYIDAVCRAYYCNIKRLARIHRYLTAKSTAVLGAVIVASRLDYCNSSLAGSSAANISRLQQIQNCLAMLKLRLVLFACTGYRLSSVLTSSLNCKPEKRSTSINKATFLSCLHHVELFRRALFVTTACLTLIVSVLVLESMHSALQHQACGMPCLRLSHQRSHC